MGVAWWCGSCGGPLDAGRLVVRVGRAPKGPAAQAYCSDECAERGARASGDPVVVARGRGPQRPSPALSVLDEICAVDRRG
jgi:hypothetical protein